VFLMIDHVHQNRGYGTMALKELVSLLSSKPGCERIWIGHNPQNTAAAHIYSKSGFQDTGRREGGEIIRCLTISRDE
jgi:diamine N-acetyltransferase